MNKESSVGRSRQRGDAAGLDARAMTRLRVLNCIRDSGEASRTDIAAALRLSPATVTFVTSGLIAGALIEEVTKQDPPDSARRGRPRVSLRLRQGLYHIAGIKVARDNMSILVLDFDGTEIANQEFAFSKPRMSPTELITAIGTAVTDLCQDVNGGLASLAGISIGLPGQIDANAAFVHWSSSLTERNVDLRPLLATHLPCPAFVENDANLVAKAEQLFGEGRGLANFLVVTVEHGVGLGIVLDGGLYRGERGCGAEFGHTKVALNGAACQCGQQGCLEAYVGSYALLREAQEQLGDQVVASVRDLARLAQDGNVDAQNILKKAGQMFSLGLANLINLFDPQRIILAGAEHRIAHLHAHEILAYVQSNVVNVDAQLPDIRVHHWDDSMWARGAAAMGIEQVSALKVKGLGKDAR